MSEAGQPTYRLEDLKQRWENNPTSRLYLQLAEEYHRHGRLEEAVAVLQEGLKQRPGDLSAHVALGRYSVQLGNMEQAVSSLEAAVARDPTHLVASKLLLEVHLQRGDAEKAGHLFDIYRLLNDRDPELEHLEYRLQALREAPAPKQDSLPPARTPTAAEAELEQLISGRRSAGTAATRVEPKMDLEATQPTLPVVALEGDQAVVIDLPTKGTSPHAASEVSPRGSGPLGRRVLEGAREESVSPHEDGRGGDIFDLGHSAPPVPGFEVFWDLLSPAAPPSRQPTVAEVEDQAVVEVRTAAEPEKIVDETFEQTADDVFGMSEAAPEFSKPESLAAVPFPDVAEAPRQSEELADSTTLEEIEPAFEDIEPIDEVDVDEVEADEMQLDGVPLGEVSASQATEEDDWFEEEQVQVVTVEASVSEPMPVLSAPSAVTEVSMFEVAAEPEEQDPAAEEEQGSLDETPFPEAAHFCAEVAARETPAFLEALSDQGAESVESTVDSEEVEEVKEESGDSNSVDAEIATVTLGGLYLKQGHLEDAAKIFEQVLARDPKNHAALAGLSLAKKPEKTGLTAMDLLADRSSSGTIPAGVTAKKVMILSNYLKHLKTARERNHVR